MRGAYRKKRSGLAVAATLGVMLGGIVAEPHSAKAGDLGGDCCADLEERVAELEATTVRKGNRKVSVTISGWVTKRGSWWDDGKEENFYVGDRDNTLSSHINLSGSAQVSPGWTAGYTIQIEAPGNSATVGFCENQFNDNCVLFGSINTLLSYMWVKSERWGAINWGQLRQATDNLLVVRDLSGTAIESNAVLYDGVGMFIRPKGARNANDLASDFTWFNVMTCLAGGGGIGADCNGYPNNNIRYDSPTWAGFSVSTSYGEDDMWDVALKYNLDAEVWKAQAAVAFTSETDEGCSGAGRANCSNVGFLGGGGTPFQGYRKDAGIFQVGGSILHAPSGLFFYGLYQNEHNDGTQYKTVSPKTGKIVNNDVNDNNVWYMKSGIRKQFMPIGTTILFGEWAQYNDMYQGICGLPGGDNVNSSAGNTFCEKFIPTGVAQSGALKGAALVTDSLVTGSEVTRWGIGLVQEIDSASMHVFVRWQRLELDLNGINLGTTCVGNPNGPCQNNGKFGQSLKTSWEPLDIFQLGGVIFF